MAEPLQIDVENLAGTEVLGHWLGKLLFPGAVVGLIGPLGAGKTNLVRAIAEGLAIPNSRVVNSPTFVLIQEYEARLPIYHFDAYRLQSEAEFLELGASEYMQGEGVSIIEWADRVAQCLPKEHLKITIDITGDTRRRFTVEGSGERYERLSAELKQTTFP